MPSSPTPSQSEASRRNGARSRGPRSKRGKERSRGNALKHGLFVRRIQIPGETDPDRHFAVVILEGLLDEFQPRTFSDHLMVEMLADDLTSLRRVRQMHAAALNPDRLNGDPISYECNPAYPDLDQVTAAKTAVNEAIQRLEKNEAPNMKGDVAAWLAERIALLIASDREIMANPPQGHKEGDPDPEAEGRKELYEMVRIEELGLDSVSTTKRLLRRRTPLSADAAARLIEFLGHVDYDLHGWIHTIVSHARYVEVKELRRRSGQVRLLKDLDWVLRHETHFTNRINRRLDRLKQSQGRP